MDTLKKAVLICLLSFLSLAGRSQANDINPLAYWSFDSIQDERVFESVSGTQDPVSGFHRLVKGVKGQAIVLDGYTTCISSSANQAPELGQAFTIEAWVAIGAYPWNWAPIVAQENTVSENSNLDEISWPDDILANSPKEGFFFGISPQGHLGFTPWNRSMGNLPF